MLSLQDQPDASCHIPRHLAQSLFSAALNSKHPEYGLVLEKESQGLTIHTVGPLECLLEAVQDVKQPVQAVYQTHFHGTPMETEAFCSLARACNRSLLCLGLGTDTEGRIEIHAFLADNEQCRPVSEELEEDGCWSAAT